MTEFAKGLVSVYHEDTANPYFARRKVAVALHGHLRQVPHWEICRPDYRRNLLKGDCIFFVRKHGLGPPRFCAGVLVVKQHLDEGEARRVLGEPWFRNYIRSARKHFRDYKRRKSRRHESLFIKSDRHWRDHVLVGHTTKSFWMGRNGVDLGEYLGGLVKKREIQPRRHRAIEDGVRVRRLYRRLLFHYKAQGHAYFDDEARIVAKRKSRMCRCQF